MKIRVGDILEIPTSSGLSYVLVVFDYQELPRYGKLVKVFNFKFKVRPTEDRLVELVNGKESFMSFIVFKDKEMHNSNIESIVNIGDQGYSYDNLPIMWVVKPAVDISKISNKYPEIVVPYQEDIPKRIVLKKPGNSKDEKVLNQITPELSGLSSFSIGDITALKLRLEQNYSPEKDLKFLWEKS